MTPSQSRNGKSHFEPKEADVVRVQAVAANGGTEPTQDFGDDVLGKN